MFSQTLKTYDNRCASWFIFIRQEYMCTIFYFILTHNVMGYLVSISSRNKTDIYIKV